MADQDPGVPWVPIWTIRNGGADDTVCQHGTAADVHCCNCHHGFLFSADECECEFDEEGDNDGDDETA